MLYLGITDIIDFSLSVAVTPSSLAMPTLTSILEDNNLRLIRMLVLGHNIMSLVLLGCINLKIEIYYTNICYNDVLNNLNLNNIHRYCI